MSSHQLQVSSLCEHKTVIYACVLEERHCKPLHFTAKHLKKEDANRRKVQIVQERHSLPEREIKGAEKVEEGVYV